MSQLSSGGGVDEKGKPVYTMGAAFGNALNIASQLAKGISQLEKDERSKPYAQILSGYSKQWAAAPEEQRQFLNDAANQVRRNFISAGGSPMDLPENLWGSDPGKGFQTGAEEFSTPDVNVLPVWQRQTMAKAEAAKNEIAFEMAKALLPYQYQTADSRAATAINQQKLLQGSDADVKRDNMSTAQNEIWQMLNSGVPIEQVEAWIIKNAQKYSSGGLNYQDLIDYAWIAKTGSKKQKTQQEGTETDTRLLANPQ